MNYGKMVCWGLKCFGTGISFLVNMLVMAPLPAAGAAFLQKPEMSAAIISHPSVRLAGTDFSSRREPEVENRRGIGVK